VGVIQVVVCERHADSIMGAARDVPRHCDAGQGRFYVQHHGITGLQIGQAGFQEQALYAEVAGGEGPVRMSAAR